MGGLEAAPVRLVPGFGSRPGHLRPNRPRIDNGLDPLRAGVLRGMGASSRAASCRPECGDRTLAGPGADFFRHPPAGA